VDQDTTHMNCRTSAGAVVSDSSSGRIGGGRPMLDALDGGRFVSSSEKQML
jgi:hypothetical protein